jgi:hypothetical protein
VSGKRGIRASPPLTSSRKRYFHAHQCSRPRCSSADRRHAISQSPSAPSCDVREKFLNQVPYGAHAHDSGLKGGGCHSEFLTRIRIGPGLGVRAFGPVASGAVAEMLSGERLADVQEVRNAESRAGAASHDHRCCRRGAALKKKRGFLALAESQRCPPHHRHTRATPLRHRQREGNGAGPSNETRSYRSMPTVNELQLFASGRRNIRPFQLRTSPRERYRPHSRMFAP